MTQDARPQAIGLVAIITKVCTHGIGATSYRPDLVGARCRPNRLRFWGRPMETYGSAPIDVHEGTGNSSLQPDVGGEHQAHAGGTVISPVRRTCQNSWPGVTSPQSRPSSNRW